MRKKSIIIPFPALTDWRAQMNKQCCGSGCGISFFLKGNPVKNLEMSRRCEKDAIAACDRRILEFPLEISPNAVAKTWYGPKTTVYYIEYRVRRLRERVNRETFRAK